MGKNEEDQCNNIFSKMGTPMPDEWPDIEELSEWHKFNIELASGIPLYELVKGLDDEGYQLLDMMLQVNPKNRPVADVCLKCPWFDDIRNEIDELYE